MKSYPKTLILFLLLLGMIYFQACGGQATETGNPNEIDPIGTVLPPIGPPGLIVQSRLLMSAICFKLAAWDALGNNEENENDTDLNGCYPDLKMDKCLAKIPEVTSIDKEVGIPKGDFPNWAGVIKAETSGIIKANVEPSTGCIHHVLDHACDSPAVQDALIIVKGEYSFEGVVSLLEESPDCPEIFDESIDGDLEK